MSINDKDENKIRKALLTKALGYTTQEITEEYGYTGEEFVLQKRKTSTKSYPPDLSALQLLLDKEDKNDNELLKLTDDELEREKQRLLKNLEEKK